MSHTNELQLIENSGWDERILVCRNGRLVNTFIIVTERFVLLVDTVINPQTAGQMLAWAEPYLTDGRQLLMIIVGEINCLPGKRPYTPLLSLAVT